MSEKKILIVDDNKDFADVFSDILNGHGMDVECCYSGEEALERFRTSAFDITFLDVKMPNKDGVEILREIKELSPGASVVMMTGYSLDSRLEETAKAENAEVLFKPFDMDKVFKLIKKMAR